MMKRTFLLLAAGLTLATAVGKTAKEAADGLTVGAAEERVFNTAALLVVIICVAVVVLAFIVKQAVMVWRDGVMAYQTKESNQKKSDELLDKYLGLLDKKTEQGVYGGDEYRQTLARLVELSQKGRLSDITEDALNAIFKQTDGVKATR